MTKFTGPKLLSMCSTRRLRSAAAPIGADPSLLLNLLVDVEWQLSCVLGRDGKPRCKEWNGVAYDTASGIYTPGHKTEFLQWYGHPGNFYPCWVSPDKEMVLMTHEWQSEFLMVPIIAVVFAIVALYMAISRICRSLPVRMRLPQYRQLPTKEHARREQHERTDRR